MDYDIFPCQFCKAPILVEMYYAKCRNCRVDYRVRWGGNTFPVMESVTYYLKDDFYMELTIDLVYGYTIVYALQGMSKNIVLHQSFPLPQPEDAVKLAYKLRKLIAFS